MSINAQKRLLIIMGSTGDHETDTSKIFTVNFLISAIHTRFPDRSYNFGTLVVYLERLRDRFMVTVVHQGGDLRYRLTNAGFDEARKLWDERTSLGYLDPATAMIDITAREFAVAA